MSWCLLCCLRAGNLPPAYMQLKAYALSQADGAGSPKYLTIPDAGTVFANATLIFDTINTPQLAVEPAGGTRADIICAPPEIYPLPQPRCA